MKLKDSLCVITGASGATGSIITEHLYSRGARVIGLGFRGEPRLSLIKKNDRSGMLYLNLGNEGDVAKAVESIRGQEGPITAWMNTAGGFHMGSRVEDIEASIWQAQWQLNFQTTLNAAKAILPQFREQGHGRLINFGSAAALDSLATAGPYIVSKAAVHALTRTIASELEGDITCNAILPGTIDTAANRAAMPGADTSQWVPPQRIAEEVEAMVTGNMNGELQVLK